MAVSPDGIEGLLFIDGGLNSKTFDYFLASLALRLKEHSMTYNCFLILDNLRAHYSTGYYRLKEKMHILFNAPYCP